ncbi:MAG: hypothetical protein WCQ57_14415 [Verrucomicrobiota bacterium]
MQEPQPSKTPAVQRLRPPDSVLPQAGRTRRAGDAYIYLSWGGVVYGPTTSSELLAGVRASWFEDDALFWHDGMTHWSPVTEFSASESRDRPAIEQGIQTTQPALPAATPPPKPSALPGRDQIPKVPSPSNYGVIVVAGFALLAAALTVGLIMLLMLI